MEILATIGTRGSPLALAQAHEVRDRLARAHDVAAERIAIKVIRTLTVAPQFEEIYNKDPRAEVKEECQKRLDKLIEEAQAEAAKGKQD